MPLEGEVGEVSATQLVARHNQHAQPCPRYLRAASELPPPVRSFFKSPCVVHADEHAFSSQCRLATQPHTKSTTHYVKDSPASLMLTCTFSSRIFCIIPDRFRASTTYTAGAGRRGMGAGQRWGISSWATGMGLPGCALPAAFAPTLPTCCAGLARMSSIPSDASSSMKSSAGEELGRHGGHSRLSKQ